LIVRSVNIEDVAQLSTLFDAYRVFYQKKTDLKAASNFLKERINNKDSELFVCENEENILVAFVQLYPLFSSTKMKKLWLLNDLYVEKHCRGKGISVLLIDSAKALVKATNACGMFLETSKTNLVGNNLYSKTGFTLNNEANYYEWLITQ